MVINIISLDFVSGNKKMLINISLDFVSSNFTSPSANNCYPNNQGTPHAYIKAIKGMGAGGGGQGGGTYLRSFYYLQVTVQ